MVEVLTIDCEECRFQATSTCDDCVVSFICGREVDAAVVVEVGEARTMHVLGEVGLVPALRHQRRTG